MVMNNILDAGSPGTPVQTLVKLQILVNDLDRTWAMPETPPLPGESTVRLRDALAHQITALQAGMRPEEISLAADCVHAISQHNLIQRTASLLKAYHYFLRVKHRYDLIAEIERLISNAKKSAAFVIINLSLVVFLVFSRLVGFEVSLGFLGYWVFTTSLAIGIAIAWINTSRPKGYKEAENDYQVAYQAAQAGNEYFWKQVRDEFGGIPGHSQVRRAQEDNIAILTTVFGGE